MRKFTFCLHVFVCMLLMSVSTVTSWAGVEKASDLFGKWKFTSTMNMTEFGQKYAEQVKQECEVVLKADDSGWFDLIVEGIAGTNPMSASFGDSKIVVTNPNGNMGGWDAMLAIANAEGEYPYGFFSNFTLTVDPSGTTITVPDFTAVVVDHGSQGAELVAKFTNCKYTVEEKEEVVIEDIAGEYHFKASEAPETASIPAEFDMFLTAENEDFTSYSVTMVYADEIGKMEFTGCSFDGVDLKIPFDHTYLNEDVFLYTAWVEAAAVWKGQIEFKKAGTSLTLGGAGMKFGVLDPEGTQESDKGNFKTVQYFYNGTAVKKIKAADFNGTYALTAETFFSLREECFPFKADFELEIQYNEAYNGWYAVKLMGQDLVALNYGGIPCEVNGNVLTMDISSKARYFQFTMDDDWNTICADYVYDGNGEQKENLTLTLNEEDGTVTMSDFSIQHTGVGDATMAAFYSNITGKKMGGDNVSAVSVKEEASVYVQNGVVYVKGGEAALQIFNAGGGKVFDGVASQVSGLSKGLYIVKCGSSVTKVLL